MDILFVYGKVAAKIHLIFLVVLGGRSHSGGAKVSLTTVPSGFLRYVWHLKTYW